MAYNVGDAVLTFFGDTTQLDGAIAKVSADTKTKLLPADKAVGDLAAAWGLAGQEAAVAGTKAAVAGEQMAMAGKKAAFNMREAKGEIALLGEEIGVKIPRHLRGFVANLPGVGAALNAAFSATAVLMLAQILFELGKKIYEYIEADEAMAEADKRAAEAKKELAKESEGLINKMFEAKKAFDEYTNSTGSTKTKEEFDRLLKFNKDYLDEARDLADQKWLYENNNEGRITAQRYEEGKTRQHQLIALLETTGNQMGVLSQKYNQELKDENQKTGESIIASDKAIADARAHLRQEQSRAELVGVKVYYLQDAQAKAQFEEAKYQNDLASMRRKVALLAKDPEKNEDAIRETNGKILALQVEHHAKMLQTYTDLMNKVKAIREKELDPGTIEEKQNKVESLTSDWVDAMLAAYRVLGIQGTMALTKQLDDADLAYQNLRNSGLASIGDLTQAEMKLLRIKLEIKKLDGEENDEEAKRMEKRIEELEARLEKLGITSDKVHKSHARLFDLWAKGAPKAGQTWKKLGDMGKEVLDEMGQAMQQSIAGAILSQESFGKALRKATAEVLAQVAAQSLVYAIFYTAMGFAKLAVGDMEGATNAFTAAAIYGTVGVVAGGMAMALNPKDDSKDSGASDSRAGESPVANTSDASPTTKVNVHRFAGGGLVSGPTLAVVGDKKGGGKQQEAILPLDDPEAMAAIVDALGGGGRSNVFNFPNVRGIVSADVIDDVIGQINKRVGGGDVVLHSTTSRRIVRK